MMRWNPAYAQAMMQAELTRRKLMEEMQRNIVFMEKSWGWEKWFANESNYCGKEIFIKRGKCSSYGRYHYHKIKDETFYVIKGMLILDYYDKDNKFHRAELPKGTNFRIKPGIKHRFSSRTFGGCNFIEASTHHDEEDSYRCYWDEKNEEWIEV